MSTTTPATTVIPGWEEDIAGIFAPFIPQMMWRLDLGKYEDVVANASIISDNINWSDGSPPNMPPPPFPPLPQAQIDQFNTWAGHGCPRTRTSMHS